MSKASEIGDRAEERVEALLGGKRVPQSGGGRFYKLDVRGGTFIVSVKATEKPRLVLTPDMFREAYRAAHGVLGTGDSTRPMVVGEVDGKLVGVMELETIAELLTGEIEPHMQPAKARERRLRARK
jgi:acetyl-CoA carboxylase carboxyltransferase component